MGFADEPRAPTAASTELLRNSFSEA